MLKKEITYTNYDNVEVTETFHFHLSKMELAQMQLSEEKGLEEYIKEILATENKAAILKSFGDIFSKAVGRRSEDGRRFTKSEEISTDFLECGAYDALFMEMLTDPNAAAEFIRGAVPAELAEKIDTVDLDELVKQHSDSAVKGLSVDLEGIPGTEIVVVKKVEDYTEIELLNMPQEEFNRLVGKDPKKWSRDILVIGMKRKTQ